MDETEGWTALYNVRSQRAGSLQAIQKGARYLILHSDLKKVKPAERPPG